MHKDGTRFLMDIDVTLDAETYIQKVAIKNAELCTDTGMTIISNGRYPNELFALYDGFERSYESALVRIVEKNLPEIPLKMRRELLSARS